MYDLSKGNGWKVVVYEDEADVIEQPAKNAITLSYKLWESLVADGLKFI